MGFDTQLSEFVDPRLHGRGVQLQHHIVRYQAVRIGQGFSLLTIASDGSHLIDEGRALLLKLLPRGVESARKILPLSQRSFIRCGGHLVERSRLVAHRILKRRALFGGHVDATIEPYRGSATLLKSLREVAHVVRPLLQRLLFSESVVLQSVERLGELVHLRSGTVCRFTKLDHRLRHRTDSLRGSVERLRHIVVGLGLTHRLRGSLIDVVAHVAERITGPDRCVAVVVQGVLGAADRRPVVLPAGALQLAFHRLLRGCVTADRHSQLLQRNTRCLIVFGVGLPVVRRFQRRRHLLVQGCIDRVDRVDLTGRRIGELVNRHIPLLVRLNHFEDASVFQLLRYCLAALLSELAGIDVDSLRQLVDGGLVFGGLLLRCL